MLGGSSKVRREIQLSFMFVVLFLVPALMYPANPPAVGDPETINYRQSLYLWVSFNTRLCSLGLALLYRKMGAIQAKKAIVPALYAAIMIIATFLAMPPNPDEITALMDLVNGFRIASAFTMAVFWGLLGVTLGAFWDKTKPHKTAKISV
jgi:predicted cobalt transporter CbtA